MSDTIERDYSDNFSIRELAINKIMPKYFEEEQSNLTVGLNGMITEYIGTVTEDAFNAASTMILETFPNRAKMPSSIYSNAAIFQLTNAFSTPASCQFLILLSEEDIKKNFIQKPGNKYNYFYIDKDTTFFVNDIPFVLDYDIEIKAVYKESQGWLYSAKYLMKGYTNTVSGVSDPYIKIRKTSSGIIALNITLKQYTRNVSDEPITDNANVNFPVIKLNYSEKLAGIDVLYRENSDSNWIQLEKKVIYSLPSKTPFCYYKVTDDEQIEITFTTKDGYFQPKFNSELRVIVYETLCEDGEFPYYTGEDISISKVSENYDYENSWTITAKPISASTGASKSLDLEELQRLTVEGFTTANALTTENDLQTYFNNYKYRCETANEVLFLKKRDDAVERLFSAFMFLRKGDYIFPTNTLTIDTNVQSMTYNDGFYIIEPGYLFTYKKEPIFRLPTIYMDDSGYYYTGSGLCYDPENKRQPTKDVSGEDLRIMILEEKIVAQPALHYQLDETTYKLYTEKGVRMSVSYVESVLTEDELYSKFLNGELNYDMIDSSGKYIDFAVDEEKEREATIAYINNYEKYKLDNAKPDLTVSEYLFEYTFEDYKDDMNIDNRLTIYDSEIETISQNYEFLFTNLFLTSITKATGLIGMYLTYINQDSTMDFISQNDSDAFIQFITYTLHVTRNMGDDKRYKISLNLLPSVSVSDGSSSMVRVMHDVDNKELYNLSAVSSPELWNFKKEKLEENDVRVIVTFTSGGSNIGYMEMIPTAVNRATDQITFEAEFFTDDYVTTNNTFRTIHKCPHCGNIILNSANANVKDRLYFCEKCGNRFNEGIMNMTESDSLLIPIQNAELTITVLHKDSSSELLPTDNIFARYDPTYKNYIWTNIYNTSSDPITFIKPMNTIRSNIEYKDYYRTGVSALDCLIHDMPFIKYSILAYRDKGPMVTDSLLEDDIGKFYYFIDSYLKNYLVLENAKTTLRNATNIDVKFYNTYGKSTNFTIGEGKEFIATNNIKIKFSVWLISGVDPLVAGPELKSFIKEYIESINNDGTNDLYISNLIREIENNFAYVHHLKFEGLNDYPTDCQSIINTRISLSDMKKEERRHFVPDLLTVNKNNIILNFYTNESGTNH